MIILKSSYDHLTIILQSTYSHLTITRSYYNHITIILQSSYNHLIIILQSSYNHLTSTYGHLIKHMIMIPSSYNHLLNILWLSYNHLTIILKVEATQQQKFNKNVPITLKVRHCNPNNDSKENTRCFVNNNLGRHFKKLCT